MNYFEEKAFVHIDYQQTLFSAGEYEACRFEGCSLYNTDLGTSVFRECVFVQCDLSMALLKKATFRECTFKECKLMGVRFDQCARISAPLLMEDCIADFAWFSGLSLSKSTFKHCHLEGTQWEEANLSQVVFDQCHLEGAVFDQTNLEGADLRTAYGFVIDPAKNHLKKARFAQHNLVGLLQSYDLTIE